MNTARSGRAMGAMVLSGFGAVWLAAWSLQAEGFNPFILACIIIAGAGLFLLALGQFRRSKHIGRGDATSKADRTRNRVFQIANAAQWIAIPLTVLILARTGHPEWIEPVVIVIVGVHFVPLAVAFHYRQFYFTGGAMVLLAIAYPLLSAGPESPWGSLGAGLILWFTAIHAIVGNARAHRLAGPAE